jgi:hypothetical protein
MSEFSAILDVLVRVVTFVFEATLDIACCAMLACACMVVWNIPHIWSEIDKNQSRSSWRDMCAGSFFLSILDLAILPFTIFIVLSPLRWSHISKFRIYNDFELRCQVMGTCMGGIFDLFGYFCGMFALISPFGRQVTISRSRAYFFRPQIQNDLDDLHESTTKFSRSLISHGLGTVLDYLVLVLLLPFLLITPSVWAVTMKGIVEWLKPANQPSNAASEYGYSEAWINYYETLRIHFLFQILHCWFDLLLAPCFLLVCISPLRQPALWRTMRAENVRMEAASRRYASIDRYDFYYSTKLREDCVTLSMLAVADLLLLPLLLPLWLTRYRMTALQKRLWPATAASRAPEEVPATDPVVTAGLVDGWQASPATSASATVTTHTDGGSRMLTSSSAGEPSSASLHLAADTGPVAEHIQVLDLADQQVSPASRLDQVPPRFAASPRPAVPGKEEEQSSLWGLAEFMLIAVQASLLLTDALVLLLPMPVVYLTQYRWGPVCKVLQNPDVFLDDTSTLYGTVLGQLSLIIWDILLAPLAALIFCTVYRAAPLREILSSIAVLEQEGLRLHLAVVINFACILHDALLLAPVVVLFPCFLVGYRAPIVYHIITNHIKAHAASEEAKRASRLPDTYYQTGKI